jgi:serine/threonine-protein kinase RsbW
LEGCKQIFFEVKSDLTLLEKVLAEFGNINEYWISKKDWLQCQLALAEGFTNAVRHAHKNLSKETIISIKITLTKKQIKIQIWDYGKPFDLDKFIANIINQKDPLAIGGRGIEILQKIADKLTYTRTEDRRNCLLIIKQLSSET